MLQPLGRRLLAFARCSIERSAISGRLEDACEGRGSVQPGRACSVHSLLLSIGGWRAERQTFYVRNLLALIVLAANIESPKTSGCISFMLYLGRTQFHTT